MPDTARNAIGGPPDGGLTAQQLHAIGRIAVAASYVELSALTILARLASPDLESGITLFQGDALTSIFERTDRLLHQRSVDVVPDDETRERILMWLGNCRSLQEERNKTLHGTWLAGLSDGPLRANIRRGGLSVDLLNDDHLETLASALDLLAVEGGQLVNILTGEETIGLDPTPP
jgi:hypothetical protein